MKTPSVLSILTLGWLLAPASSAAQTVSAQVTVKFPVNLTQFGPDFGKAKVMCDLTSDAITNGISNGNHTIRKEQELPLSGGQVTADVSLVFSLTELNSPTGKVAAVSCVLFAWNASTQLWIVPGPNETNPSFKTSSGSTAGIGNNWIW